MGKKDLLALATKFLSRRILALGSVLYAALQGVALPALICLSAVVAVYIACVTFGPNKENGGAPKAAVTPMLLLCGLLLLSGFVCTPMADAKILPIIDKLDLQIGPGMAVTGYSPLKLEMVALGTAKVFSKLPWKLELRLGGLIDDDRRALVFGLARDLSDLLIRDDGGEDKSLLPSVGLWFSADLVSSQIEGQEDEYSVDFLWGVNAVLAEF